MCGNDLQNNLVSLEKCYVQAWKYNIRRNANYA